MGEEREKWESEVEMDGLMNQKALSHDRSAVVNVPSVCVCVCQSHRLCKVSTLSSKALHLTQTKLISHPKEDKTLFYTHCAIRVC